MSLIKNLLFPEASKVKVGTIISKLQDSFYLVQDDSGKQYTLESTKTYVKGQSVSFVDNVILNTVKSNLQYSHYTV